jgi:GNAT superfamily N-acetyltransferase
MKVRLANSFDALSISRVHIDTWHTTYRGIVPDDFLARMSYEMNARIWVQRLDNPDTEGGEVVFVCENEGNQIVGFAAGGPERSRICRHMGELYGIYVLEAFQRKGVGRRLVRATAERLLQNDMDSMLIWTLKDAPSCQFYEILGGKIVATKQIDIGGMEFQEVGYIWKNLRNAKFLHD